ncbi:MAG: hypothetical protein HWN67_17145 [Candidatus Helarchaeota archaeon]|nr:hypothetical protein [Candidatus Helarchaeota archaeon]
MKIRKKLVIFFLLSQFLCQFFIISNLISPNEEFPYSLPPDNIVIPFKIKDVPSPQYEDFFSQYNWEFDPDYAPLQILTVVHHDENSNLDDFAYLSAIPNAIFNDSGIRKISPIIYDNVIDHENTLEFLREWKQYNDIFGGLKRVIYIGDVSTATQNKITDIFGTQGEAGTPIYFDGNNIFDLSAQISDFFWYKSSKAVLVLGNDTFNEPESIYSYSISDNINPNTYLSLIENITNTNLEDIFTPNNITLNGGAIFAYINDTNNKLALDLIGNYTSSNRWVFDTDNSTDSNLIFFPNVTYPANLSDWAIRVYNTSQISSDVVYNITFWNFTGSSHVVKVNYSNSKLKIDINWTDSQKDIDLWLLNPDGQLVESSDRNGYLYENGETNESISIEYPSMGNWTIIVTANENQSPINYTLSINFLNHSNYKTRCIESASNGAVIASLLHTPILFTDGNSLSTYTREVLSSLALSEVIVVEPNDTINETLITELGISTLSLENLSIIREYIQNISLQNDFIITTLKDGYFAAASLLSAYHGGVVLPIFNETFNFYSKSLSNYKLMEYSYFQTPLTGPGPIYEDMTDLSDIFHNLLNDLDPGGINRTVITVSQLTDLYPIFERAIIGESFSGRFPGENEIDDAVYICRSILYRATNYKKYTSNENALYQPYERTGYWANRFDSLNGAGNAKGNWGPFNDGLVKEAKDGDSHFCNNSELGEILRPSSIRLNDYGLVFDNITKINIKYRARIGYNDTNIQFAGLKIWNWTASNFTTLSDSIFNSTDYEDGFFYITEDNKSHFISSDGDGRRIELFMYVNTTGPMINASVDQVQFNITMWSPFARQNILSSSISYWHNFTFGGQTYNYSEVIPNNFSNYAYIVNYSTSFSNITDFLKNNIALWYLCGMGNYSGIPFNDNGSIKLMTDDYWRGFNTGQTPEDPIGAENPVDPSGVNEAWITGSELFDVLINESLNLSHIILNNDFLASTQMPNLLLSHGASVVVANLRDNMLGYSEYLFYIYIQNLLKNKTIGKALNEALNGTSHLYSKNWKGNIAESPPFPNNSEDYHQFVIFGDPESYLANSTSLLLLPGNYKPIAHKFYNKSTRRGQKSVPTYQFDSVFDSFLYANITDIDNSLDNLTVLTVTPSDPSWLLFGSFGNTSYSLDNHLYNIVVFAQFHILAVTVPLNMVCSWYIDDQTDLVEFQNILSLYSSPPTIDNSDPTHFFSIDYYQNGSVDPMYFDQNYTIGRVNQTLNASIVIRDTDHNNITSFIDDQNEWNVTLHLIHKSSGIWVKNLTMQLSRSTGDYITSGYEWIYGYSQWNTSYIFTDDDPIGEYEFYVTSRDNKDSSNYEQVNFTVKDPEVTNWPAELVSFTNNTNSLFRVNETLNINATFFDRDDFLDENFSRYKENNSIILSCEGNNTITNVSINGSYFENDYQSTFADDNISHVIINDSYGKIRMPYSINLSNAAIEYDNITEIEIKIKAFLNNTENVTFAGWQIYNWNSQSLYTLSNNIFNSTNKTSDKCYISKNNLSNFVNQTDNRIEIFFYLETNTTTNASIDFIEFNVTYPVTKTGITAKIKMYNPLYSKSWINRTMTYDKVREIWEFNWIFSPKNDSGTWFIHFNITDKENIWKTWNVSEIMNASKNITVKNHDPNWVSKNISTNSTYRGNPIEFYGNATDLDVFNRTEDLTLRACLYHAVLNKWDNSTILEYNNITNGWNYSLILNYSFRSGNWSFQVSVRDKHGGYNETNKTYLIVLNNLPVITITKFSPSDFDLYEGESIYLEGSLFDVEELNISYIQLNDSSGKFLKRFIWFPPGSTNKTFSIHISKRNYQHLSFKGKWTLYIFLNDMEEAVAEVTYRISCKMPPLLPPPPPFSWDFLIIAGLIVTVVLGTILVYRFYRREQVVVPASRVKAIIKKMIDEKEVAELEEEKLIKERLKKEKLKKKPSKKIKKAKPVSKEKLEAKKEKLDKLEIKNLEVRLSETLNSARQAIRKKNFNYAAELYQRAAKISSKLGDLDKAKKFSERAEELYKRGKKKFS